MSPLSCVRRLVPPRRAPWRCRGVRTSWKIFPVAGHLDALDAAVRRTNAEPVVGGTSAVSADDVLERCFSRLVRRADIQALSSADLSDQATSRVSIGSSDEKTTLAVRPGRVTLAQAATKRALDLALGSV